MKHSERPVIIFGAVLLLAAAFFTISIFLHFVHFGTEGSFFFLLSIGTILFSVYGYSCFLIPVFLFASAIVLFLPEWNQKKAVMLGVSIFPFFTTVIMERVCGILLPDSTFPVFMVKLIAIVLIGGILIIIEYLSAAVLYDAACERKTARKGKAEKNTYQSVKKSVIMESEVLPVSSADEEYELAQHMQQADNLLNYASINAVPASKPADENSFTCDNKYLEDIEELTEIVDFEDSMYLVKSSDTNITEELNSREEEETLESLQQKAAIQESIERQKVYENNGNSVESELFYEKPQLGEITKEEKLQSAAQNDDTDCIQEEDNEDTASFFSVETPVFGINHENEANGEKEEIPQEENTVIPLEFTSPDLSILDIAAMQHKDLVSIEEEDFLSDPFEDTELEEGNLENSYEEEEEDYDSVLFDDDEEDDIPSNSVQANKHCPPSVQNEGTTSAKKKYKHYSIPSDELLTTYPDGEYWIIDKDTQDAAALLKDTLSEFRIQAEVTGIRKGPVITMFEILPAPGVKLSKIVALQDNIALRLAASSVRIVAPIPGKSAVGIEVPNKERAIVSFKELIEADNPAYKKMSIPVILGKDITGEGQFLDLTKTPHLLIAGSTGSGKSVCVNTMILSILYKRSPQEVKMILIDPKVVELKLYNDIPHLLTPVITEPKKAFQALQYCLCEMERRYALLDGMGVREINSYNRRIVERNIATEKLPYIVVVIDEFADLMATTGKELESTVARLAAMSRAVGIHLVLATQRPSIDVITGLIKANIPTRIAFMVASKMDSRIIIDQVGAEKLLGKGDMLYASATDPFPIRIQGTFVSDTEVENVVEYVKRYGEPEYIDDEIFVEDDEDISLEPSLFGEGEDPLYDKALEIVIQAGKASASYIQRRLKIGYNRAARLVEDMEARGIVGPANGSKPREIVHIP